MKKIDVKKLISKGSPLKKASVVIAHYNIKEYNSSGGDLEDVITDEEALEIIDSLKNNQEILVYNQYRILNIRIIQFYYNLERRVIKFSRDYYLENMELIKFLEKDQKNKRLKDLQLTKKYAKKKEEAEKNIIRSYLDALNYYVALLRYKAEMNYKDAVISDLIHNCLEKELKQVKKTTDNIIDLTGVTIAYKLNDIGPEENVVNHILYVEFGLNLKL